MSAAPPRAGSTRWRAVCAYDGRGFAGWQSQPGGGAVQDVIEARLAGIFGQPIRVHGSGRTDAGVHALAQVFHFDAPWRHGAEKLLAALRMGFPETFFLRSLRRASPAFHARFDATGKRYFYQLHLGPADPFVSPYAWSVRRPLDVDAMRAAAAALVGRRDFRALSALNGPEREDTVRDVRRLEIARRGARLRVTAEADGFLYKMVRSLVGALVAVGVGKLSVAQLEEVVATRKRAVAIETAPAHGLFLERVFYGRSDRAARPEESAEE